MPERTFYSPCYDTPEKKQSDYPITGTLFCVETDVKMNTGSTVSIPFYTSDYKGKYIITIEGITKKGEIIYDTLNFEVE